MYITSNQEEIKAINQKVEQSLTDELLKSNMTWDDIDVLISVEFKDTNKPSKTYLEFERFLKKESPKQYWSKLSDSMKQMVEPEDMKTAIEDIQSEMKLAEKRIHDQSIESLKLMLQDSDNELQVILENKFIRISKNLEVTDYNSLPDSLKQNISSGGLQF